MGGFDWKKQTDKLVKALASKGKYYTQTTKRYKHLDENGVPSYRTSYRIVDSDDKTNYVEVWKKDERFYFFLDEWNKIKDK